MCVLVGRGLIGATFNPREKFKSSPIPLENCGLGDTVKTCMTFSLVGQKKIHFKENPESEQERRVVSCKITIEHCKGIIEVVCMTHSLYYKSSECLYDSL